MYEVGSLETKSDDRLPCMKRDCGWMSLGFEDRLIRASTRPVGAKTIGTCCLLYQAVRLACRCRRCTLPILRFSVRASRHSLRSFALSPLSIFLSISSCPDAEYSIRQSLRYWKPKIHVSPRWCTHSRKWPERGLGLGLVFVIKFPLILWI